jgi:hypothetical protein
MADSIELFNGVRNIQVHSLDYLKEPSQQLANAIATGPQDDFFQLLEEINRYFGISAHYNTEDITPHLSVTPSWNWRPGTLNKVKEYVHRQLQLGTKSSGLGKYIYRAKNNAQYRLSWMAQKLTECERLKRVLKRDGYSPNVDIEEYKEVLVEFCNNVESNCKKASEATDSRVKLVPYIHITENERNTRFYLFCNIGQGDIKIVNGESVIQEIPMSGINIVFSCSLRLMTQYLANPAPMRYNVQYTGMYDSPVHREGSYRSMQQLSHPYIAQPSRHSGSNHPDGIRWSTVCLSSFTDDVRKAFHQLNYVVLGMQLLEWSSYYHTNYSNPYNQPTYLHFGMPKSFSKEYQATMSRDTQSCANRMRNKYFNPNSFIGSVNYENQRLDFNEYCNEIECIWRNDCNTYRHNNLAIKSLSNDDYRYMVESIIGYAVEDGHEAWILDDYEVNLNLPGDSEDKDNLILDWYDITTRILISSFSLRKVTLRSSYAILRDMYYWGEEKKVPIIEKEAIPNNDRIKEQMLQWATERTN